MQKRTISRWIFLLTWLCIFGSYTVHADVSVKSYSAKSTSGSTYTSTQKDQLSKKVFIEIKIKNPKDIEGKCTLTGGHRVLKSRISFGTFALDKKEEITLYYPIYGKQPLNVSALFTYNKIGEKAVTEPARIEAKEVGMVLNIADMQYWPTSWEQEKVASGILQKKGHSISQSGLRECVKEALSRYNSEKTAYNASSAPTYTENEVFKALLSKSGTIYVNRKMKHRYNSTHDNHQSNLKLQLVEKQYEEALYEKTSKGLYYCDLFPYANVNGPMLCFDERVLMKVVNDSQKYSALEHIAPNQVIPHLDYLTLYPVTAIHEANWKTLSFELKKLLKQYCAMGNTIIVYNAQEDRHEYLALGDIHYITKSFGNIPKKFLKPSISKTSVLPDIVQEFLKVSRRHLIFAGLIFTIAFFIIGGPLNYLYLKKKKKLSLLIFTVPIISITITVLMTISFFVLSGFQSYSSARSIVMLEPSFEQGICLTYNNYNSNMTPLSGFSFDRQALLSFPIQKYKSSSSPAFDYGKKQKLSKGLFSPGNTMCYCQALPFQTKEKILLTADGKKAINGLGEDIEEFYLFSNGKVLSCRYLDSGSSRSLRTSTQEPWKTQEMHKIKAIYPQVYEYILNRAKTAKDEPFYVGICKDKPSMMDFSPRGSSRDEITILAGTIHLD